MDFDEIDSGECASYASMATKARQQILGASIDPATGKLLDWRMAVKCHPFFKEVTEEAVRHADRLGECLGTLEGLLQALTPQEGADNEFLAYGARLRGLVHLYQLSPVPTAAALARATRAAALGNADSGASKSITGDTDADANPDAVVDDGSATEDAVRKLTRDVTQALQRGSLKEPFGRLFPAEARRKVLSVLAAAAGSEQRSVSDW